MSFLIAATSSFAQSTTPRSYASGHFALDIQGSQKGWVTPVQNGDTLFYTINRLADSVLVKQKFNKISVVPGKKYYLRFKLKKKPD